MKPTDEELRDAARALFHAADAAPADHEATRHVILAAAARQKRVRTASDFAVAAALVCGIASASWVQSHAQSVVRPWLEQAMNASDPRPDRESPDSIVVASAAPVARVVESRAAPAAVVQDLGPKHESRSAPGFIADAVHVVAERDSVRRVRRVHPRVEAVASASATASQLQRAPEWAAFDRGYRVTTPAPLVVIANERDSARWSSTQPYAPVSASAFREQPARNARFFALNPRDRLASLGPLGSVFGGGDPSMVVNPVTFRTWQ